MRENSPRCGKPHIYFRSDAISTKNWDTQNLRMGVMPETVEVAELLHELLSAVISPDSHINVNVISGEISGHHVPLISTGTEASHSTK